MANYFLAYHELVLSRLVGGVTKLYPHQREALLAIYHKAANGEMTTIPRQAALVLAGVGTGKTLIQALTPFVLAPYMTGEKALFLSDNCTLRSRFLRDFPTDSRGYPRYHQWLLYSLEVLPPGVPPPRIVELDASNFNSYAYALQDADMLVGNRQFVLNLVNRGDIEPEAIGALVVDEAHFSAAASYRTIVNYCQDALLTYFTGSKFRSDSQPLPQVEYTEVVELDEWGNPTLQYAPIADYEFTLQQAWKLNPPPIKKLTLSEATSAAFLIEENGVEVTYTPEQFFIKAQSDRAWFRQILFGDRFTLPVLQMAVDILLAKRQKTGQPHAMIVRALNIAHVHRVAKLLQEHFPILQAKVGLIHSETESYDLAGRPSEVIQKFYHGELWVLVHCGMVGVGFDHAWASVSCCLCVLKSLSPAEQEWGRIIRRVPGELPGYFPKFDHPNWGVVVTHESLEIRPLFEQFIQGVESDTIRERDKNPKLIPVLTTEYEAGETVIHLSDTASLKPGDVLQMAVPVNPVSSASPPFNLAQELGVSRVAETGERYQTHSTQPLPKIDPPASAWETEVQAIQTHLAQLRSFRQLNIQVEAILDPNRIQITPTWLDIPMGIKVSRSRSPKPLPDAHFLDHINLDWQIMVGEQLLSYTEYRKRSLLQSKGLELSPEGEILTNGVPLTQTMPPPVYEVFLKGLEAELATLNLDLPHSETVARPDVAKLEIQARYGSQVKSLIRDLFRQRRYIPDGVEGTSLIERPVKLLSQEIERVRAKGQEIKFKNNQQLLHSAVFAHIKEKTGKSWSEHSEEEYKEACQVARIYLMRLLEQLQWRKY
ncbi:DEAD/DEAH box helicase family protein [Oscillatoria amoena NRMC-F 0135]|nr:DEAD/DEAH box helicase family protein [Geitlerinema splendidum]MDL5046918.1 DEAD/DEAH box helicase family protein [Oscillatoria amoena NRMC-F 0135]